MSAIYKLRDVLIKVREDYIGAHAKAVRLAETADDTSNRIMSKLYAQDLAHKIEMIDEALGLTTTKGENNEY